MKSVPGTSGAGTGVPATRGGMDDVQVGAGVLAACACGVVISSIKNAKLAIKRTTDKRNRTCPPSS